MAFMKVGSKFYNLDYVASAELQTKKGTIGTTSPEHTYTRFTLYNKDRTVFAEFGSETEPDAGQAAYTAFAEAIATRP